MNAEGGHADDVLEGKPLPAGLLRAVADLPRVLSLLRAVQRGKRTDEERHSETETGRIRAHQRFDTQSGAFPQTGMVGT